MIFNMIKDRDNVMSPACRDEGQMILTRSGFVNRLVPLCQRLIAPAHLSEIKNVSFLIGFLNWPDRLPIIRLRF